jgi:uncharacterized membrane protein YphA (DoxX/SURF4 family)
MRVRKTSLLLWTAQVLLAALFIFAGTMKLILPPEAMVGPVPLPVPFLRFIGAMEILGAAGLLLPGLLRIRRELTPLAGIGLLIIMVGATVITLIGGQVGPAAPPFAAGVIAALVIYGRRDWLLAVLPSRRSATLNASTSRTRPSVRRAA